SVIRPATRPRSPCARPPDDSLAIRKQPEDSYLEETMRITRRQFTTGTAAAATIAATGLARPAIAQAEPIRLGWLAAMTGPSSAPAIGFNRGVVYAAEAINAAGGVKGRKIEVLTRDTQGDPTKAVNATQEMISQLKVHAIWGPTNSGESLAVTPIM